MRRVVVTGWGVVSPIGNQQAEFFCSLRQAKSGIRQIQSFDASRFPTQIAGEVRRETLPECLCESPYREAIFRDPKARFALTAALEAVDSAFGEQEFGAGYLPSRRAAFIATGLEIFHLTDLGPFLSATGIDGDGLHQAFLSAPPNAFLQTPSHLVVQHLTRIFRIAGRVAINVSACAAGTQALGEAFWALRDGCADVALVGGYDSMVNPLGIGGFSLLGALSRNNDRGAAASRPFDAHRDGFVLGEGAGFVVLEEMTSAISRGARLWGEILGYGSSLDAFRVSDPDSEERGAVAAMLASLADAGLAPSQIDYLNAHGTATRKNDPAETRAIHTVFGDHAHRLPVSSTKSQIGHLIGAAGAVEFLAGLFALAEQTLPATLHLDAPDPECDLDYVPHDPRPARVDRFLSNSFGFGGQNACLIAGRVSQTNPLNPSEVP